MPAGDRGAMETDAHRGLRVGYLTGPRERIPAGYQAPPAGDAGKRVSGRE